MPKFRFDGDEFDLLTDEHLTFAEGAAACSAAHCKPKDLADGSFEVLQAFLWLSVRRKRPEFMFSDLNNVPVGDIEFLEDEAAEPDPTPAEAAPSETSD